MGVFTLFRQEVRPFSDKQIELVKNFAAQAVSPAILSRCLHPCWRMLFASVTPSLAASIASKATACTSSRHTMYRRRTTQHAGFHRFIQAQNISSGRMRRTKSVVQITDAATDPGYVERRPEMVAAVELGGVRTMLAVPMLRENDLVGVFALNRQEVRPFSEKQIALVTNFAAQSVIAMRTRVYWASCVS